MRVDDHFGTVVSSVPDLDFFIAGNAADHVWLNDSSGTFTDAGQSLDAGAGSRCRLGDLNGDGLVDAFVVEQCGCGPCPAQRRAVAVFVGNGQSLGSSDARGVELGDFNEDGHLDAFVVNFNQANQVWLNDGSGSFSSNGQSLAAGAGRGNAISDLNGDGHLDVFVVNSAGGNRLLLGDGSGHFSDSGQTIGTASAHSVDLADLNGDGYVDAFIGNSTANKVWFNDGSGHFSDSGQLLGTQNTGDVALGDLNGDGTMDAFVANSGANQVWLNDGSGHFSNSGQTPGQRRQPCGRPFDANNDGYLDAIVANSTGAVCGSTTAPATSATAASRSRSGNGLRGRRPADIDNDGSPGRSGPTEDDILTITSSQLLANDSDSGNVGCPDGGRRSTPAGRRLCVVCERDDRLQRERRVREPGRVARRGSTRSPTRSTTATARRDIATVTITVYGANDAPTAWTTRRRGARTARRLRSTCWPTTATWTTARA